MAIIYIVLIILLIIIVVGSVLIYNSVKSRSTRQPDRNVRAINKVGTDARYNTNTLDTLDTIDTIDSVNTPHSVNTSGVNTPHSANSLSVCSSDITNVNPCNDSESDDRWDKDIGNPLMTDRNKKRQLKKIEKEHDNFQKALGKFIKHQTDPNIIIKTDVTIDPNRGNNFQSGRLIKDIYDEKVQGPKAKPKKIKKITDASIVYSDENEMNNGKIKGMTYTASKACSNKLANFGNEF